MSTKVKAKSAKAQINDNPTLVHKELQRYYDHQIDAIDSLDKKLQGLIGYSSIIFSAVGLINFPELRLQTGDTVRNWALWATILYLAQFLATIHALNPKQFFYPVGTNWDEVVKRYLTGGSEEALKNLVVDYIQAIDSNSKIIVSKASILKASNAFLLLLVVSIAILLNFQLNLTNP